MIFAHGDPARPLQLWEYHMDNLIEDYLRVNSQNDAVQRRLHDLNSLLLQTGKSQTYYSIPLP